jgi:hypothetical protein
MYLWLRVARSALYSRHICRIRARSLTDITRGLSVQLKRVARRLIVPAHGEIRVEARLLGPSIASTEGEFVTRSSGSV